MVDRYLYPLGAIASILALTGWIIGRERIAKAWDFLTPPFREPPDVSVKFWDLRRGRFEDEE